VAVANYQGAKGDYPPAHVLGPDGRRWHSWRVLILPYIGGSDLFNRYSMDEPWNGPHNRTLAGDMPKLYAFHGTHFPTTVANYLAVVGNETMWPGPVGRKLHEITADRSSVIHVAENQGLGVHWMEPRDLDAETMSYEFNHPHGLSSWYTAPAAAMADGSLRTFTEVYDREALKALLRVAGKPAAEPVGRPLPDGRQRERAGQKRGSHRAEPWAV
jgi:hypothetical protein